MDRLKIYLWALFGASLLLLFPGFGQSLHAQSSPAPVRPDFPGPTTFPDNNTYWPPDFFHSFNYLRDFPQIPAHFSGEEGFTFHLYKLFLDSLGRVQNIEPLKTSHTGLDSLFRPYLSKLQFTPAQYLGKKCPSTFNFLANPRWIGLQSQPEKPCRPDPKAIIIYDQEAHPVEPFDFHDITLEIIPEGCLDLFGKQVYQVLVDEQGKPIEFLIMKSDCPPYSEKVREKVMKMSFYPARKFKQAVCSWVTIPIHLHPQH